MLRFDRIDDSRRAVPVHSRTDAGGVWTHGRAFAAAALSRPLSGCPRRGRLPRPCASRNGSARSTAARCRRTEVARLMLLGPVDARSSRLERKCGEPQTLPTDVAPRPPFVVVGLGVATRALIADDERSI